MYHLLKNITFFRAKSAVIWGAVGGFTALFLTKNWMLWGGAALQYLPVYNQKYDCKFFNDDLNR